MSAPTRLHLVRHGQVAPEWRGRIYGNLDVPLSDEGRAEARRAAERCAAARLAAVVSSGLERAEYGAALLRAGRGLERRDEPDLREIDRGNWRGLTWEQLARRHPGAWERWLADPAASGPPGGESLADLAARVLPRIDALAAEHAGDELAIVSHSWVIRVLVCTALGLSLDACVRLELPTGALVVIDWPPQAGARATLAGFVLDGTPPRRDGWFRGPRPG